MKYCRECGSPVEEENIFCRNCGTKIKTKTNENTKTKYSNVKQNPTPNTQKPTNNKTTPHIQKINQTPNNYPKKESKAKIYLLIMIIVLVLLIGAGIILSSFAPTETTYEGEYFSFNYPTDYTIEPTSNTSYLEDIVIYNGKGDYVGTIYVWKNNAKISLDEDLKALEQADYSNTNVQYVNFAGFSNVIEETGRFSDGDNYKGYFIQENGYSIQISLVSDIDGM